VIVLWCWDGDDGWRAWNCVKMRLVRKCLTSLGRLVLDVRSSSTLLFVPRDVVLALECSFVVVNDLLLQGWQKEGSSKPVRQAMLLNLNFSKPQEEWKTTLNCTPNLQSTHSGHQPLREQKIEMGEDGELVSMTNLEERRRDSRGKVVGRLRCRPAEVRRF
jgi:hypothetical protein